MFEQALGGGDGQGSLACCSPWGCKESDTTERLNGIKLKKLGRIFQGVVCKWRTKGAGRKEITKGEKPLNVAMNWESEKKFLNARNC